MSELILFILCVTVYSLRNVLKGIWMLFEFCFIIALFGKTFLFISLLIGFGIAYIAHRQENLK